MSRRLVFLSHSAGRSGAPRVLLNLMSWISSNEPSWDMEVVFNEGGPLVDRFASFGVVRVVNEQALRDEPLSRRESIRMVLRGEVFDRAINRRFEAILSQVGPADLLYLNSAVAATLLPQAIGVAPRLLSHLHELRFALKNRVPAYFRDMLFARSDRFIVPSRAAGSVLTDHFDIDPEVVDVRYEFIDTELLPQVTVEERAAAKVALGIDPDTFVVGGAGRLDWMKGADLFIHLAQAAGLRLDPLPAFVWIGGIPSHEYGWEVLHAFESSSFSVAPPRFLGETDDVRSQMAALDVFALPSREDPFPLVCLEAASLGIPTVCFDTGGIPEFVSKGAGRVVPYADFDAFVGAIDTYRGDSGLRAEAGNVARELVVANHDISVVAPFVKESIDSALNSARRT